MKILAIDTSAFAASCAILDDDRPVSEFYTDSKITHSQTIMPMVEALLKCSQTSLEGIDLFAVSTGPGSFTGLRIGVAATKGMAQVMDKPCLPISTLEGLAYNLYGQEGLVCSVLDARCGQVYAALFALPLMELAPFQEVIPGVNLLTRLTQDSAMMVDELCDILSKQDGRVILVGDGAPLCLGAMERLYPQSKLEVASKNHLLQRAYSVGLAAYLGVSAGERKGVLPGDLLPAYLKLPQAQRELMLRQESKK